MSEHTTRRFTEPLLIVDENRLAYEAVRQLVTKRSPSSDASTRKSLPSNRLIYLHGPSGVGKSHLIRSLLADRLADPNGGVVLMTASQFAQEFAEALETDCIAIFRDRIRAADVLVCEDLQSMVRHKAAQEEFQHAIDHCLAHIGRVIVSAASLPGQLSGLQQRLVNRLHGGLSVSVSHPGRASRLRFLSHFADRQQVPVGDKVLAMLAKQKLSPGELNAAVQQLKAEASLPAVSESQLDSAKRLVAIHQQGSQLSISEIAKAIAQQFGVKLSDMRSPSRARDVANSRQCAMWLSRRLTDSPLTEIAKYFGRRNHSTVLHACTKIEQAVDADAALRKELNEAMERLKSR